jgi:hypothetical protein
MNQFSELQTDLSRLNADDWPDIEPLSDTARTQEIPLKSIIELGGTEWFIDAVETIAAAYNLPRELTFCNALGAVNMAVFGKAELYVNHQPLPINLYQIFIYPPARGKSIAQNVYFKSLFEYEQLKQNDWQHRKDAAGDDFSENQPQMIADDFTPEAILPMLKSSNGKMAVISAEDSVFPLLAGRYDKNKSCRTSVFKKCFYGEAASVNRAKTGYSGTICGFLSICIGTQPASFEKINNSETLSGDGTLSRFIYCFPDVPKARRREELPELDTAALAEFYRQINNLMADSPPEAAQLKFFTQAAKLYSDYKFEMESETDDHDQIAAWRLRCAELAARLAANLHFIRHTTHYQIQAMPQEIERDTLAAAVAIIRAAEPHTRRAYGLFEIDSSLITARKIVDWIKDRQAASFTVRELFNNARRWHGIKKRPDIDPALNLLADFGYIRAAETEAERQGRPSEIYDINPKTGTQYPQK